MLNKLRIAVATNGKEGLEDHVSQVFGRAATFTIVDVEGKVFKKVRVIRTQQHHTNREPALSLLRNWQIRKLTW